MSLGPSNDASTAGGSGGLAPDTTAEQLASLAAERPDLWPEIWQHPNCYDGLRKWMADRYWAEPTFSQPGAAPEDRAQAAGSGNEPSAEPEAFSERPDEMRRTRSTATVVVAVVLILALAFGGGVAALSLTGKLDRWFGGGSTREGAPGVDGQASGFSNGMERAWIADSDDYVTPKVGELGQDFSYLRSGFSRASIALVEADYPVATKSAVAFNARGEGSTLVMLDAASGDTLLEHDLDGLSADCAADEFGDREMFYCVTAHDQRSRSTLLQIDASGDIEEVEFDLALHRVEVGEDRIVLAGQQGAAVALDRSGRQLWQRDDLENGGFAGIDFGAERTLIRGYDGWTLLGSDGGTLASAEVSSPYDGGNGACDARLTASGRLFVAGEDSCLSGGGGVAWWSRGENLMGTQVFSADGGDYLVSQTSDDFELLRFSKSEGEFEKLFDMRSTGEVLGVTGGDRPVIVIRGADTVTAVAVSDGAEVASWPTTAEQQSRNSDQSAGGSTGVLLDESGTVLIAGTAYDVYTGERLWTVDAAEGAIDGWVTSAGLLVLGGGCPECSIAGGSYTTSTLTLYSPSGSGGIAVSTPADSAEAVADIEVPDFIPSCPGRTILLAWAEFSDGWIVVCGVNANTPSYVEMKLPGQSRSVRSVGASKPTSQQAKASVRWDAGAERYSAKLADGSTVVLDHRFGTATVRDSGTGATATQQRMIRYIFVPLGSTVRTSEDAASGTGAYGVRTPEATAEDQIRFMIEVLEKAYDGRALVKEALPKLQACSASAGGYGDAVEQMRAVRDNRAELLAMLDGMPVDKIPEGEQLLDDLTEAIRQSHAANVEYVAWAEAANASGCAQLSAAGQAAAAASDAPKDRFAARWNRAVAPVHGVRTFDAWYI